MMDWSSLVGNILWILGSAAALATVSHASWEASSRRERFFAVLRLPAYQIALALAAILFCLGMCLVASSSVEIALWLLMAAGFTGYAGYQVLQVRNKV
jgi:hypothetical protein